MGAVLEALALFATPVAGDARIIVTAPAFPASPSTVTGCRRRAISLIPRLSETAEITFTEAPGIANPRSLSPAAPWTWMLGARARFDPCRASCVVPAELSASLEKTMPTTRQTLTLDDARRLIFGRRGQGAGDRRAL